MVTQTGKYIDYIVQSGDTFDSIALAAYSEERMASVIIGANREYIDVLVFEGGEKIKIPVVERADTPDTLPPWRR